MTGTESLPYVLACILPFVLLGGWLLNATRFKSLKEFISAQRWQSVTGRIILSKAVGERQLKGGVVYFPHVEYEYQVDGQTYKNKRIHAGGSRDGIRHEETVQNNVTREYPVGKEALVYYNPGNPAESALRKKNASFVFIFIPMTILFDIGMVVYFRWLVFQASEWLK
ncbi:MAG: DUF3592 domain-containing protein [Anaerolineales bacterium]|nr:DUF3592 domain-containing protein [Anaerolineales bacterium]